LRVDCRSTSSSRHSRPGRGVRRFGRRGGLNSAILNSTNNLYLNTECGINRIAIRSTLTPGTITLTATRAGLTSASVQIESQPVEIKDGLEMDPPQAYSGLAQMIPGLVP